MVILAAVKRSEQTGIVSEAHALAEAFGDELHVVNVTNPPKADDIGPSMDKPEILERFRANAAEIAQAAAQSVAPDANAVGLLGKNEAKALLAYADEHDARYLVVGGRRRSPAGKALFGSTTQDILLQSDRPVVTVIDRR